MCKNKSSAITVGALLVIILILFTACGVDSTASGGGVSFADTVSDTVVSETDVTTTATTTAAAASTLPFEPEETQMVRVVDYIPSIVLDIKYATEDNFTGVVIYDFNDAYLRYGTVKKLAAAQEKLNEMGYSLKIWDAFRPTQAQKKLWEICPDPRYVSNPENGYSGHCRGNTVDVTLLYSDGAEVEMPTGYDDFSDKADRDYSDVSQTARENVSILEQVMYSCGFEGYFGEWWHYSDSASYPVIGQ